MQEQLVLPDVAGREETAGKESYIVDSFSAGGVCPETARQALERRYEPILEVTDRFDRRSVSYQLSKKDALHSWLKYKEGFSADLVNTLLDDMGAVPGDTVMDPFVGSGTTALVCQMRGVNSIGYDVLPLASVAIAAKANVLRYDLGEIRRLLAAFTALTMPADYQGRTPCLTITYGAYPAFNERFLQYAAEWIAGSGYSEEAKNLFTLCVINSLERCSYTEKSGQYLRWDSRSKKVVEANIQRARAGKKPLPQHCCRQVIENVQNAVAGELRHVLADIAAIQAGAQDRTQAAITYKQNSALFELPQVADGTVQGVITSPPYCNRYDYTRTYALELAYLGTDEQAIRDMRQALLSCTVENKPKLETLRAHYEAIGAGERFRRIAGAIRENAAFQEVLWAIAMRRDSGELNNSGVLRMVEGYFTELAFIYAELYRVCRKGATVAFVNDNVRYGGEVIPVDYLSTSFAEQFGFTPVKVYCLKQQKGNSSQQMKRYGRVALRKSVTVWRKL